MQYGLYFLMQRDEAALRGRGAAGDAAGGAAGVTARS
jgi:hypothetical protein